MSMDSSTVEPLKAHKINDSFKVSIVVAMAHMNENQLAKY